MIRNTIFFIVLLLIWAQSSIYSQYFSSVFLDVIPKNGDGVISVLKRYDLPLEQSVIDKFYDLNRGILKDGDGLKLHLNYKLPIEIVVFNGKNIRNTLKTDNYDWAKLVQDYNIKMLNKGLKLKDYKDNNELWIPYHLIELKEYQDFSDSLIIKPDSKNRSTLIEDTSIQKNKSRNDEEQIGIVSKDAVRTKALKSHTYEIFGNDYKIVDKKTELLKGQVFYLISGHGGTDPGATASIGNKQICEDEYAYDVTLRTARLLLENNATVHIIVRDSTDGIRDGELLDCDTDEYLLGGEEISPLQIKRLRQRTNLINKLAKNYDSYKNQHVLEIHVDSRYPDKRIDIFFYHKPGSHEGLAMATSIYEMFKKKYDIHQPGRGYQGSVSSRNLLTPRESIPLCIYIELGNIQNSADQVRFFKKNNRQAMAKWLVEGIIDHLNN